MEITIGILQMQNVLLLRYYIINYIYIYNIDNYIYTSKWFQNSINPSTA